MQNIVKNTDCTNHIKELWKVFTKEGKELFSYTIRGEGDEWLCLKCGDHIDDNDIELLSSPTEEASYPDDDLEPEPEWYD